MERRLIAGLLVLVLAGSVVLAYAAPPPKLTLEDVMTKLVEIEGKLWSNVNSVKNDTTAIKAKLDTLLGRLTTQRASSLDTVPKVVIRSGSKTFPAGTQGFKLVVGVDVADGESFDISFSVSTAYPQIPGPSTSQSMTIGASLGNRHVAEIAYYWHGTDIIGIHIVHLAAQGFSLYYDFGDPLPSDVTVYYSYTVTTTAGVEVVETIY